MPPASPPPAPAKIRIAPDAVWPVDNISTVGAGIGSVITAADDGGGGLVAEWGSGASGGSGPDTAPFGKRIAWSFMNHGATGVSVGMPTATAQGSFGTGTDGTTNRRYWRYLPVLNMSGSVMYYGHSGGQDPFYVLWEPEVMFSLRVPDSSKSYRAWAGWFASGFSYGSSPNTSCAAFRYDTGVDGTAFWRCVTSNGTNTETTTTSIPIPAAIQRQKLLVSVAPGQVDFYIDGTLVATHTTYVPASGTSISWFYHLTQFSLSLELQLEAVAIRVDM